MTLSNYMMTLIDDKQSNVCHLDERRMKQHDEDLKTSTAYFLLN